MTATIDVNPILALGANLDQYMGLWAVEESRFLALFDRVAGMDLLAHVMENRAQTAATTTRKSAKSSGTIGIIDIQGTMTKAGSSLSTAGSTVLIRQAVRQAAGDADIAAIVLRIDSPGGTVAGTADLAREVARANEKKPVVAFVEDLAASAAYWVASQAGKVIANDKTAMVGSIGTFLAMYDLSAAAAMQGIKPVVIRAGAYKGVGFEGTEITDDQKAYWQERVDKIQVEFSAGIARGRGFSAEKINALADGKIHVASDALGFGLIDEIQSLDETIDQLRGQLAKPISVSTRTQEMSEESTPPVVAAVSPAPPAPVAASFEDLKIVLPNADNDFICAQMEKKATIDQARTAWDEEQSARLKAAEEKTKAAEAKADTPGVEPLGTANVDAAEDDGDPIAAFKEAVAEKMKQGMTRQRATAAVVHENHELHQAYLKVYNAQRQSA